MFVNIMQFPSIQPGKEEAFHQWFKWSNEQYAQYPGFISRRLLKSRKEGDYVAIVEHESLESFIAMHNSPTQASAHERLKPLIDGTPAARFYDLIMT